MKQPPSPHNPDIIGMYERATREIKRGECYFFVWYGVILYGMVDGDPDRREIYMRIYDEAIKSNKWFIIDKKWLLTPRDYFELLN